MKYFNITKEIIKEFDSLKIQRLFLKMDGYTLELEKDKHDLNKVNDYYEKKEDAIENLEKQQDELEIIYDKNRIEIKSPLVGVFYEGKEPGAQSFVKEGDLIKKGDILCILESMKMMNEIKSPCKAKIIKIYCMNEELVDFGQKLFMLEKLDD